MSISLILLFFCSRTIGTLRSEHLTPGAECTSRLDTNQRGINIDRKLTDTAFLQKSCSGYTEFQPARLTFANLDKFNSGLIPDNKASRIYAFPECMVGLTLQEHMERSFLLRHFAEVSSQWMDVCTGQKSYFRQHIIQLASQSPLLSCAACAMAAIHLGRVKDSAVITDVTIRSNLCASTIFGPVADFRAHGSKYYQKAIWIMIDQINEGGTSVWNLKAQPHKIYQSPEDGPGHREGCNDTL